MYARQFPGYEEPLTFGVSGKLIKNALVMYDRQTDSLWSQFLGVAVRGPFTGEQLQPLPSIITTWAEWREEHPDTLVLDQGRRRRDAYAGYYADTGRGVLGVDNRDNRLTPKEFVLSVRAPEIAPRAYPYRFLNDVPVVNDELDGTPIVVAFDPETGTAAAYRTAVGGRVLTFEAASSAAAGTFVDRETGSTWSVSSGRALDGPLAGEALEAVSAVRIFWFAWIDFFPDGEVWMPPGVAADDS